MKKKLLNFILFVFIAAPSFSQTGGDNIYEFLNLTHSGLVSSLGGTNVSLSGNNLNLAYHNPALLNSGAFFSFLLLYSKYTMNYLNGLVV